MLKRFAANHWLVLIIFLIALFLRIYNLGQIPVGLHGDEASIGYNAFSLLKTAHDQNGNYLPIAIDQFGDFRPAGYHYLDIPFVAILGLNELAVRLPAAIFGALSVFAIYFLLYEFFERRDIAFVGALVLAILPWDVNISRASSESIIASFFVTVGLYFLIRFIKRKHASYIVLLLGLLPILISFFFYHAPRFFVPAFLPFLILFLTLKFKPGKKKIISVIVVYSLVVLGLLYFLVAGSGGGRASEVSIFNIPGGATQLKQAMDEEGTLNPILTRFYDNKLFFYGRFFSTFYSEHLSLDFLFVNNGLPIRYKIPQTGNLYFIMLPFLLFGIVVLVYEGIKSKKYHYLIPIAWLLIAPIPAGLTWEDLPNVIRASLMITPLVIISVFGFFQVLEALKKKNLQRIIIIISAAILLQNFLYFYHNYYWRAKVHEPWYRSGAEKELLYQLSSIADSQKKVLMTTEGNNNLIFYLFYNKFDPETFQRMGSPKEHDGLQFLNIRYTGSRCPVIGTEDTEAFYDTDTIYVDKNDCHIPKNAEILKTIRFVDGTAAFKIVKVNKPKLLHK